jgi:hypothetical protein
MTTGLHRQVSMTVAATVWEGASRWRLSCSTRAWVACRSSRWAVRLRRFERQLLKYLKDVVGRFAPNDGHRIGVGLRAVGLHSDHGDRGRHRHAINATETLIIVDVGTLGIDSAGLGMVVGVISGGGWRPDQLLSIGDAVQPPPGGGPLGLAAAAPG